MFESMLLLAFAWLLPVRAGLEAGYCPHCIEQPDVRARAEALMLRLQRDLALTREGAAAVAAHAISESLVRGIEEVNPAVPGSRGGIGMLQWTGEGPHGRRRAFEQFAADHHLDPHSAEASIRFFEVEIASRFPEILAMLRTPGRSATQLTIALQAYIFGADIHLIGSSAGRAADAERLVVTDRVVVAAGPAKVIAK